MTSLPASFLRIPITHRGLHNAALGISENSRAAFTAAIKAGFAIEADLQLSSDSEAMVFHDHYLERLTNSSGAIRMRTAAELRKTKLKFGTETIFGLYELLELVNGRVPILIELKDQDGAFGSNVGQLELRTAEILRDYKGDVAVMSFNPHMVMNMADLAPTIPRGLTTSDFDHRLWPKISSKRAKELAGIHDFDRTGSCFISHNHELLNTAPVSRLRSSGVPVLCWTIKSAEEEAAARRLADNFTFEGYIPAKHSQLENPHD